MVKHASKAAVRKKGTAPQYGKTTPGLPWQKRWSPYGTLLRGCRAKKRYSIPMVYTTRLWGCLVKERYSTPLVKHKTRLRGCLAKKRSVPLWQNTPPGLPCQKKVQYPIWYNTPPGLPCHKKVQYPYGILKHASEASLPKKVQYPFGEHASGAVMPKIGTVPLWQSKPPGLPCQKKVRCPYGKARLRGFPAKKKVQYPYGKIRSRGCRANKEDSSTSYGKIRPPGLPCQ